MGAEVEGGCDVVSGNVVLVPVANEGPVSCILLNIMPVSLAAMFTAVVVYVLPSDVTALQLIPV